MRLSYCNPAAPTADAEKSQPAVPEGGLSAGQGQGSHYPGDGRMNPALLPAEPLATAPPVGPGPALNGEVIARLAGSGAAKTPVAVGQSGPADAQALDRKAAAPATPHVYKAEWAHYAAWCAQAGIALLSADPAGVGSYLTSLAKSHAPSTIRRRLSAIGKMHRDNDLPWNRRTAPSRNRCRRCFAHAAARCRSRRRCRSVATAPSAFPSRAVLS